MRVRTPRAPSSGVVRPRKQDHPKTTPNAFFIFRKNFWKNEKHKPSGPISTNHRVISKLAGIEWGKLSQTAQAPWYALAAEGKLGKTNECSEDKSNIIEQAEEPRPYAARYRSIRANECHSSTRHKHAKINEQLEDSGTSKVEQFDSTPPGTAKSPSRRTLMRAVIEPSSSAQCSAAAPSFPYYHHKEETDNTLPLCQPVLAGADSPAFAPTEAISLYLNSPLMVRAKFSSRLAKAISPSLSSSLPTRIWISCMILNM